MLSGADFRQACGAFPTGVTIVTRAGAGQQPMGVTVSAFTSVSLDPPLVAVCIRAGSGFLRSLAEGEEIYIDVPAAHQSDVSGPVRSPAPAAALQRWRLGTTASEKCAGGDRVPAAEHSGRG